MPTIASEILNPVLINGLTQKITWLEASQQFELDDLIDTFYATRERTIQVLDQLTDEQTAFHSPAHPFWSISESITHLIYSQNFYFNMLLDLSSSQLPHMVEAARGQGEGAQLNIAADALRIQLANATDNIHAALEDTRYNHDGEKLVNNAIFGRCNYKTWVLLLLGHEVDHLRQMVHTRRLARAEIK